MPIDMNNIPAIVHLTPRNDIVPLTAVIDNKYLVLSLAKRIPGLEYHTSTLTHSQLGAAVSLLFEDDKQIDNIITCLEDLKKAYNVLKNR